MEHLTKSLFHVPLQFALFLGVIAAVWGPTAGWADAVPQHLVPMAVDLMRGVRDDLKAASGDSARADALRRAYDTIKEQGMFHWGRKGLEQKDLVSKIAGALELETIAPDDIPRLQRVIERAAKGEAKEGIIEFFQAYGRQRPNAEKLAAIEKKLKEVLQAWTRNLSRSHVLKSETRGPSITLDWDVDRNRFTIAVESDGSDGKEPFRTTLTGIVRERISENGRDISISVEPTDNAISSMTANDLEKERHERRVAILGEWRDQDGRRWVISRSGGGNGEERPRAQNEQGTQQQIDARRERIKQLQASRLYLWRNPKSGEEVRQTRFKRLAEPFEFLGQVFPDPSAKQESENLKREIEELAQSQPNIYVPSAPRLPESNPNAGVFPLVITRYHVNGHVSHFRDARVQGNTIRGNRKLRGAKEITDLPPDIVRQLSSMGPPEWLDLKIRKHPETGEVYLEGARYRLHVTYEAEGKVESIHTPYPRQLRLTRRKSEKEILQRVEIVAPDPPHEPLEEVAVGERFRVRLVFSEDPEVDSEPVILKSSPAGDEIPVVAKRTDDPLVLLTEPVLVTPPEEPRVEP